MLNEATKRRFCDPLRNASLEGCLLVFRDPNHEYQRYWVFDFVNHDQGASMAALDFMPGDPVSIDMIRQGWEQVLGANNESARRLHEAEDWALQFEFYAVIPATQGEAKGAQRDNPYCVTGCGRFKMSEEDMDYCVRCSDVAEAEADGEEYLSP